MYYDILFRDHGGYLFSATTLEAPDDTAAIEKARIRFRSGVGFSYEIRRDERRIHIEYLGQQKRHTGGPVRIVRATLDPSWREQASG